VGDVVRKFDFIALPPRVGGQSNLLLFGVQRVPRSSEEVGFGSKEPVACLLRSAGSYWAS